MKIYRLTFGTRTLPRTTTREYALNRSRFVHETIISSYFKSDSGMLIEAIKVQAKTSEGGRKDGKFHHFERCL
jgi:hypothetical protein